MARKTHKASLAALGAVALAAFAGIENTGANAQQGDESEITAPNAGQIDPIAYEVIPADAKPVAFVSQPVVQKLPAKVEAEAAPNSDSDVSEELESATRSAGSLHELVKKTPKSGALDRQMKCLAGAVYFESRGEPLEGQLAVARVIMNRAESRAFPSDYCGVVYQRSQFSFVRGGKMPRIKTGSSAWKRAVAIARIAHNDSWESKADDALYFHAQYVKPSWAKRKTRRVAINSHIFYR